jgi:hypothetical protein
MTYREAIREFNRDVRKDVVTVYGKKDAPAIREAWNNWTDALQRNGRITTKQYNDWVGPQK